MPVSDASEKRSAVTCGGSLGATGRAGDMARGVNVLALLKNGERYVFLYDDQSLETLLQTLGRYASDPELSFSWYDAAVLSQRVRQPTAGKQTVPEPHTDRHRFREKLEN